MDDENDDNDSNMGAGPGGDTDDGVIDALVQSIELILRSDATDKVKIKKVSKLCKAMLEVATKDDSSGDDVDAQYGQDDGNGDYSNAPVPTTQGGSKRAMESLRNDAILLHSNYVAPIVPRRMSRKELILSARAVDANYIDNLKGVSRQEKDALEAAYQDKQERDIDRAIARRKSRKVLESLRHEDDADRLMGVTGAKPKPKSKKVLESLNDDCAGLNSKLSEAAGIMGHNVKHH